MNNDNGQDQGGSGSQNLDNPALGNQGGEANQSGTPSGQDGQQTNTGNADELTKYKNEVVRLNKALIDARRGSRQQPQNQGDNNPFETPEGQYAISLEVATGQLSRKLEDVYDFYPEIPASEIARIRRNPWAFASFESYKSGDVATAIQEIEFALLERANELGAQGQENNQANGNAGQQSKVVPASINPNQPQEQGVDVAPGSAEDENPWTMPLDKLERKAKKQSAQNQAQT